MPIQELVVDRLRGLEHAELRLAPSISLIFGPNGSGKTSLLESMFLLGRGRSFRTRSSDRLIRLGEPSLTVFGRTFGSPEHRLGVEVTRTDGVRGRVDGTDLTSLAELSGLLPIQAIDPDVHRLIEDGSYGRRRWLDWAVFHVEPSFGNLWSRFQRALKQRNALLRHQTGQQTRAAGALEVWDAELLAHGSPLSGSRERVIAGIQPFWKDLVARLIAVPVDLTFFQGWPREQTYGDALRATLSRDEQRGLTSVGPQRADIALRVHGKPARDVLSRGQQKLAAATLILAQLQYLRATTSLRPTLLLDDPAAELDDARLSQFIETVQGLATQLVITSLRSDFAVFGQPEAVFHVEQGRVQQV